MTSPRLGYQMYNPGVWQNVTDGMVYVDVGAHGGKTVLRTLEKYPSLTCVAIEPHPIHFQKMVENIQGTDIVPVNKACWNKTGTMMIYSTDDGFDGGASFFKRADINSSKHYEVTADILDQILYDLGIDTVDLLKIDTEGAEHLVLQGFSKYSESTQFHIETHSNLDSVLYELLMKKADISKLLISNRQDPGGAKSASIYGRFGKK